MLGTYFTYDYNLPYEGQIAFLENKIKKLDILCQILEKELNELLTVETVITNTITPKVTRINPVNFSKAIKKGVLLEYNMGLMNIFVTDLKKLKAITAEEYDEDCKRRKSRVLRYKLDDTDYHWKNAEGFEYKYEIFWEN